MLFRSDEDYWRNIDGVVLFGFTGIKDETLKPWQSSLVLLARDAR